MGGVTNMVGEHRFERSVMEVRTTGPRCFVVVPVVFVVFHGRGLKWPLKGVLEWVLRDE